jgi:hypothetical protein
VLRALSAELAVAIVYECAARNSRQMNPPPGTWVLFAYAGHSAGRPHREVPWTKRFIMPERSHIAK